MKLEEIRPAHCHARARRLLADITAIREEMGRSEDARPIPEIVGAQPREVYFEALATWNKAERLATELGVQDPRTPAAPPRLAELKPGHVMQLLDAIFEEVSDIRVRLKLDKGAAEPAVEAERQPSDVLMTLIRCNRELSRMLEQPFSPSDVYRQIALASAYAARLGSAADLAPYESRKKPADVYARLEACLALASSVISKRGGSALTARGMPTDVLPGDVYDLASLVLGELAYLHDSAQNVVPLYAFEPRASGHVLPSHCYQLAATLERQLSALR